MRWVTLFHSLYQYYGLLGCLISNNFIDLSVSEREPFSDEATIVLGAVGYSSIIYSKQFWLFEQQFSFEPINNFYEGPKTTTNSDRRRFISKILIYFIYEFTNRHIPCNQNKLLVFSFGVHTQLRCFSYVPGWYEGYITINIELWESWESWNYSTRTMILKVITQDHSWVENTDI